MTIRVAQWGTGIVGGAAVRAIAEHPELELVACLAWGKEKVGRNVGELCGIGKLGVRCRFHAVYGAGADFGLITAMPAVHAIPAVVAARPGLVTAADLPLVVAAHAVRR